MFEFLFVIGIVLAFYGYSVMKNPHVWGDQGRDEIRPENWNGYVAHNGQFMMYSGFFSGRVGGAGFYLHLCQLAVLPDFAGRSGVAVLSLGPLDARKRGQMVALAET